MKSITLILSLILTMVACNTPSKENNKKATKGAQKSIPKETTNKTMPSADYTALLTSYSCDMDITEVAKVLDVSEANLSTPSYEKPNKCNYSLKGFGENSMGGETLLFWGAYPTSKKQNKKEIATYIKNQKELPEKVRLGMSIALADTQDCYIAHQPAHGRVIIYNENYDYAFILNYGQKRTLKTRTDEQHKELQVKMTKLANYLLKKHRK